MCKREGSVGATRIPECLPRILKLHRVFERCSKLQKAALVEMINDARLIAEVVVDAHWGNSRSFGDAPNGERRRTFGRKQASGCIENGGSDVGARSSVSGCGHGFQSNRTTC